MRKGAPGTSAASVQDRVVKELKTNWWLWGSIVFAVLLVGSLVVFRENLYDSAKHGLPFLAGIPTFLICIQSQNDKRPWICEILNFEFESVPTDIEHTK